MNKDNNKDTSPKAIDFDQAIIDTSSEIRAPKGLQGNLILSDDDFNALEQKLINCIDNIEEDSSKKALEDILVDNERVLRGEFDSSISKPWATSSEIESTLTATHCRIIANAISRTLLIEPYFVTKGTAPFEQKYILSDFLNNRARYDFDYEGAVLKLAKIASETPFAVLNPVWSREVRKDCDYEIFKSVEAYKTKYPDAESAGLSEAEYKRELEIVKTSIDEKGYHECVIEFDNVVLDAPRINVIHPSDFIMYPFNAARIDLAKLVGHKIQLTYSDIRKREADGVYFEGSAQRVKDNCTYDELEDLVKEKQEAGKGIEAEEYTESYKTKIYDIYIGVVKLDPDDTGEERDYEFAYCRDERILLRLAKSRNHIGARPYIIAAIDPDSKTAFGTSIPERLKTPQATISTIMRQMLDSNTICNVPMFKANASDKAWLERSYQQASAAPGRILWLNSPSSFEQFNVRPIDSAAHLKVIQYLTQDAEMLTGAARTLAGQTLSEDPEAPGVKTAMLIQQSNFMVNQYIKNLLPAIEKSINFIRALYRQHLAYTDLIEMDHTQPGGNSAPVVVNRDSIPLLDPKLTVSVRPQRVDDNQQMHIQNARADLELLGAFPLINQNPIAVRTLLRKYLMLREGYTMDDINMLTSSIEEILATLQSAQADMAKAQGLQQQVQQLRGQQQADYETAQEQMMGQLKENMAVAEQSAQAGQAPQGQPPQGQMPIPTNPQQ